MKPKQIEIILAIVAVLLCAGTSAKANIFINDGQNHVLSGTYGMVDIAGSGTHAQVVDGAYLEFLGVGNYATAEVDGGTISPWGVQSSDNAVITINGGTLGGIKAAGQSLVELNGGMIQGGIRACDYSITNIRGGVFSQLAIDRLRTNYGGTIYLYGDNFTVGGQQLNYGDNLRDYALSGTVSGTLADGSLFSVPYSINTATGGDIIVVPEPATLCLLALGGLFLRRRRNKNLP